MGCARIEINHRISDVNLFISRAVDVLKQDPGRRDQPMTKRFICPCGCITAQAIIQHSNGAPSARCPKCGMNF